MIIIMFLRHDARVSNAFSLMRRTTIQLSGINQQCVAVGSLPSATVVEWSVSHLSGSERKERGGRI